MQILNILNILKLKKAKKLMKIAKRAMKKWEVMEKKEENSTKQSEQSEQDSAAVRIQCAFRQRVARDEVRERKEGKSPASAEEFPSRTEQQ
jgi:hypothetical protein